MTRVCICQICTCGRHRCPHHPQSQVKRGNTPCLLSEYNNRYHAHPIEKREAIKPKHEPKSNSGPLEDKTTHRVDYIKHAYEKPYAHQGEEYVKPEGDMNMDTNYKHDYNEKPISRAKPIKREGGRKVAGKFEGDPTYKSDYRKWSAQREKPIIRETAYRPSSQPFQGQPTYVKDYTQHPIAVRSSMKPAETARQSDQPFDDRTGYRDEFIKHPMGERHQREKPVYAPNPAKLDGISTYHKDYPEKQGLKTDSFKPSGNAYQSNAPFDEDTTQRVDYKKWPAERPFVHQHEQYQKPEGDMDMTTTNAVDYDKKPMQRVMAAKPMSRPKVPGKFDGTTNYTEDFRKWQAERVVPKVRSDYRANEAPFEGTPTYMRDYIKHQAAPPHSMKPADTGYRSGAPFEDGTEYKQEYLAKKLPPCPAGVIESGGAAAYAYDGQDEKGHKWYNPTTTMSVTELQTTQQNGNFNRQMTALSVA